MARAGRPPKSVPASAPTTPALGTVDHDELNARTPSEVFATQLRAVRDRQGLTQAQLAERLRALGHALDRTAISNIEATGRSAKARQVTIDDVFAFAAALGVSPMALCVPRNWKEGVTVLPRGDERDETLPLKVPASKFRSWWRGDYPLRFGDGQRFHAETFDDEFAAFERHRKLRALREEVARAVDVAGEPGVPPDAFAKQMRRVANSVEGILLDLEDGGER
jgi:transcriptional regulator with XRE-family HTH domain